MAAFDEQEERKAGDRVKTAFKRLRDLGIVDANGELLTQLNHRRQLPGRNATSAVDLPQGECVPK